MIRQPAAMRRALVVLVMLAPLGAGARAQAQSDSAASNGLEQGKRLFDARRYDAARSELESFERANPSSAASAFYLGRIALAERDLHRATDWLERAVKLDGNDASYHFWLGQAYARQALTAGRLHQYFLAKKVRSEFERAVRLDSTNIDARAALFQFYAIAPGIVGGSLDEAQRQAELLMKLDEMRGLVASAFLHERRHDMEGAERDYREAAGTFPDSVDAVNALGLFYTRQKEWPQAFATFEQIIQRRPEALQPYYYLGRVGALSGTELDRSQEALTFYLAHRPGEDDPPLAHAHTRLGEIYAWRGDTEQARREFQTALQLQPDYEEAQNALKHLPR